MTRPTVLLRHVLTDDSAHFDWMLAQDAAGVLPLVTFRLADRPDEIGPGRAMRAERLADHRPTYLRWEGTLSGGRGTVERVRAGTIEAWDTAGGAWRLEIRWDAGPPRRYEVQPGADGAWTISMTCVSGAVHSVE